MLVQLPGSLWLHFKLLSWQYQPHFAVFLPQNHVNKDLLPPGTIKRFRNYFKKSYPEMCATLQQKLDLVSWAGLLQGWGIMESTKENHTFVFSLSFIPLAHFYSGEIKFNWILKIAIKNVSQWNIDERNRTKRGWWCKEEAHQFSAEPHINYISHRTINGKNLMFFYLPRVK